MQKKKLKFHSQQHPVPSGVSALDSIMIHPKSSGVLNAGQYSKDKPHPRIAVKISATNNNQVEWEEKMLGDENNYTLTYEINNYNDSPAFAYLIVVSS